jgi:hypothetical protein
MKIYTHRSTFQRSFEIMSTRHACAWFPGNSIWSRLLRDLLFDLLHVRFYAPRDSFSSVKDTCMISSRSPKRRYYVLDRHLDISFTSMDLQPFFRILQTNSAYKSARERDTTLIYRKTRSRAVLLVTWLVHWDRSWLCSIAVKRLIGNKMTSVSNLSRRQDSVQDLPIDACNWTFLTERPNRIW